MRRHTDLIIPKKELIVPGWGPRFKGFFEFGRWVNGKIVWEKFSNGNTTAGLSNNLSVYFASGTQITTWYLGLIDNVGFSALAAADTPSSHAGWTENVSYAEAVRQTWSPTVTGASVTNSTAANFTINATVAIKGAFLISNSTKSGTTGTLWATGAFPSVRNLVSGQVLPVRYTLAAA